MTSLRLDRVWAEVHHHLRLPPPSLADPQRFSAPRWACGVVERRLDGRPQTDLMGAWLLDDQHVEAVASHAVDAARALGAPLVWLEWDEPIRRSPPVWFCATTDRLVGAAATARPPLSGPARRSWVLALATSLWPDPAVSGTLGRCLDALPEGRGELLHVASLAPRGREGLRLTWQLPAGRVVPWLSAWGWTGDVRPVSELLVELAPRETLVGVQTELLPEPCAYLGVEVPEARRHTDSESRWRRRLDVVRRHAVVDDPALASLSGWSGPARLMDQDVIRHAYVKLVRHDVGWEAKGYWGITPVAVDAMLREAATAAPVSGGSPSGSR